MRRQRAMNIEWFANWEFFTTEDEIPTGFPKFRSKEEAVSVGVQDVDPRTWKVGDIFALPIQQSDDEVWTRALGTVVRVEDFNLRINPEQLDDAVRRGENLFFRIQAPGCDFGDSEGEFLNLSALANRMSRIAEDEDIYKDRNIFRALFRIPTEVGVER
jgi:hypothetical protein